MTSDASRGRTPLLLEKIHQGGRSQTPPLMSPSRLSEPGVERATLGAHRPLIGARVFQRRAVDERLREGLIVLEVGSRGHAP